MMDQEQRCCCFTGHRIISNEEKARLRLRLREELQERIRGGYGLFIAGGAQGFDTLAAQAVLELRKIYPQIRLKLVLPCKNQTKGWQQKDKEEFRRILAEADVVEYICEDYIPGCMQARNRRMVELSMACICYQRHPGGGTGFTVDRAKEKGIAIWNLAEK